jgi:SAM-dependent methyltransferase
MDRLARQEYHEHQRPNPENDALQVRRDELSHPYDWITFLRLVRRDANALRRWRNIKRLVGIGSGTGFELAMLWNAYTEIEEVFVLDIGHNLVRLSERTFARLGSKEPTLRVVADFNALPFGPFDTDTVGLVFRALHHSNHIPDCLDNLMRTFQRLIVVEPVWNPWIKALAAIGVANRIEHVDERPQRLHRSALRHPGWRTDIRYLVEIPRDRLPGLNHRQGPFRDLDVGLVERELSRIYANVIWAPTALLSRVPIGNYAIVTMEQSGQGGGRRVVAA